MARWKVVNKNQKYTNKHNGDGTAYQFPPPPIETVTARDPAGPPSPDGLAAHIAHAINFHSPIFTQPFQRWRGSFFFSQNESLPASDGRPAPGPAASPHSLVTIGHRHICFFKFCSVEMLCVQFASKPPRETQMSCKNQRIKTFGLLTSEFAFPISEIAMQMRLTTWQNLTSKVKPK